MISLLGFALWIKRSGPKMTDNQDENVPAFLVLENGVVLNGRSFGAVNPTDGEVGE